VSDRGLCSPHDVYERQGDGETWAAVVGQSPSGFYVAFETARMGPQHMAEAVEPPQDPPVPALPGGGAMIPGEREQTADEVVQPGGVPGSQRGQTADQPA
jgi:hypothetical protein